MLFTDQNNYADAEQLLVFHGDGLVYEIERIPRGTTGDFWYRATIGSLLGSRSFHFDELAAALRFVNAVNEWGEDGSFPIARQFGGKREIRINQETNQ